jgi:hypothetical protein
MPMAVSAEAGRTSEKVKRPNATFNMNALHRLDFAVKGTSCPACLKKMQIRVDGCTGVVRAAIMLRKPFGGVVIYDASKTSKEKVFAVLKGDEKKVTFEQIEDAPVAKLPVILVPHNSFAPAKE